MTASVMTAPALRAQGVSKRYGDVLALDDVSLEVSPGEVYALLGLPTSCRAIVAAKDALALAWCLALATLLLAACLDRGALLGLPAVSGAVVVGGARVLGVALLTAVLALVHGLAASAGRGYLPGVASLLGALFAGQVLAVPGFGAWFPFSVPAMMSGAAGEDRAGVPALAVVLAAATGAFGWAATALWWQRADHPR